jgi:hypothetical protein
VEVEHFAVQLCTGSGEGQSCIVGSGVWMVEREAASSHGDRAAGLVSSSYANGLTASARRVSS